MNYYMIHDPDGSAREIFDSIDWKNVDMECVGAPQITSEMLIELYEESKRNKAA